MAAVQKDSIIRNYILNKIVKLLKALYHTRVKTDGKLYEVFDIYTHFQQGCIWSVTLFNSVLDYVVTKVDKETEK